MLARYMRHPVLIAGRYLFAKPERHITVTDFQAWRLIQRGDRRRRRFSPKLTLDIQGYTVVLQGYNAVWDFLDCLHSGLLRRNLNYLMKGYEWGASEELQILIEESSRDYICFDLVESGFAKADTRKRLLLPTKQGDKDCSVSFVSGKNIVFAVLASKEESLVLLLGEGGVRPRTGVVVRKKGGVAEFISENLELQCGVVGDYKTKLNMFEEEADELEYLQYLQLIQNPVGKNTGSQ